MALLKTAVLFTSLTFTMGFHVTGNEMNVKKKRPIIEMESDSNQWWEKQQFLNSRILVEEESGEFVVLRERRAASDANKDTAEADTGSNSGSGSDVNDECSPEVNNSCGKNFICKKSGENYKCVCKPGYSLNGDTCNDVNECEGSLKVCSVNADCWNTDGSHECKCGQNYYGDGKICYEVLKEYSTENVYSKPGENAVLVCTFNDTIFWVRDGKRIESNERRKIYGNVLVIKTTDENDFGEYVCQMDRFNVSIKMNLFRFNEEGGQNVDMYLIPLVIISVLFFVSLLVIVYLIYTRKPSTKTTSDTTAKVTNDNDNVYEMPQILTSTEGNYSSLSDDRGLDPIFRGLSCDKKVGESSNTPLKDGLYEPVDPDLHVTRKIRQESDKKVQSQEGIYSSLSDDRGLDPVYQGLSCDKKVGESSNAPLKDSLYEPTDPDLKSDV